MQYDGYRTVNTDSYEQFKSVVNGNGYNVDYTYGDQCWDLMAILWYSLGFPQGYPTLAGTGSAWGAWTDRENNKGTQFDLIYNVNEIKRGDVIVYDRTSFNADGHIGIADVNYSDVGWSYPELPILSQNNQGTPYAQGGSYANIHGYDITLFLGAFRLKKWQGSNLNVHKSKFPWVLYANKLRES